ncbi:MAG: peptidoglycan-binding domain-containing protein [Pseudomonadota bacterium]|nr:peptidoglycan-binding domain-containing protein [Pseudomonadota bacterium]
MNTALPGDLLNSTDWTLNFSDCERDLDPTYNLSLSLKDTRIEAHGDWSNAYREGYIKLRGTYEPKTAHFEMVNRMWQMRGKFYTSDGVTKVRGELEGHPTLCGLFTGEQSAKTKKDFFLIAALNDRIVGTGKSTNSVKETFGRFAAEILDGIADANLIDISGQGGYGRPAIAIMPLTLNKLQKLRVGPELAGELNARLLAELIKQGAGRFKFVETVSPLWIGDHSHNKCPRDSLCGKSKSIFFNNETTDIVIVGDVRVLGRKAFLSYRAFGVQNGIIYAASVPQQIRLSGSVKVSEVAKRSSWERLKKRPVYTDHGFWSCQHMKFLQRGLRHLGYSPGKISGKLDPGTRKAIRSYQWHHNLPVTGLYSATLLDHVERQLVIG